ncbi:MAG: CHAT domain-containing tetratricopeptide repeat protein, partial [Myxococcota bacterium]
AIAEATLGEDHPILARRLANLAAIRIDRGDYPAAEPPLRRALAISERSLGPDHLDLAPTLTLLAHLLEWTGRYTEAEPVYRRALAIQRAALGPRHADVGFATDDLAVFLTREWRLDEAADLHQQAITILEEALGPDHPKLEHPLANLGLLAVNRGQLTKAEPLAARALAIATRAHGPDHPKLASSLNDLAYVHDLQGRYAEAEAGYRASIALVESAFGTDHESAVSSLVNLAMMNVRAEHSDKAVGLLADAADREERALLRTLGFGTARQRERRLAQFGMTTGKAVSLHLRERPDDDAAAALALQTVLRRKGRLEALEMQLLDPAGRSEEGSELREALASVTTRLDLERTRARPDAERIEQLTGELDRIQSALAAASGAYAEASRTVALEEVAAALPAHTALLELVVYRPFDARRAMFGADHYAAYVLRPDGSVRGVALGPADPIDREVRSVREAIVRQRSVSKAARRLSSATLGRLGDALRDVTHLYVAPDGPLALVPLEVLGSIGPTVSYLTSGRELLRAPEAAPVGAAPWVIYDVDYDRADRPFPEAGPAPRVRWDDLPGAEAEGAVVARKLRGAHTLTGPAATETALRQLPTPRVLHVASHGFIDAAGDLGPGTTRGLVHGRRKPAFRRTVTRHPMLGSGVVLAGANRPPAGDDNGQLTAAELSGLDLRGTQLVVLSACHTGEGELRNGDGVHGLRRGLVLAGSRTQVLSLWAVPDEATAVLMRALYQALARGATVADALKKAQAAVARRPGWAHPWYWAAFTVSGDPEVRLRR